MKTPSFAAMIILTVTATAAAAGPLPLKPGTYVLIDSPCADHPNAAEFSYDGRGFSYPHSSRCVSKVLSIKGSTYRVATTCSAAGDGSPTAPLTLTSTYRVTSRTRVSVRQGAAKSAASYRWCPAP